MMGTTGTLPGPRWRARAFLAVAGSCALAALGWTAWVPPVAHIVYNPSDSVPAGWYRIQPAGTHAAALPVGSIVLVRLPTTVAALAAQRGYLPAHIPLLKRVGAVAAQHVCVVGQTLHIDGMPAATVLAADRQGRALPAWRECRRLASGELFLLSSTHAASFDSRYFGPIHALDVLGIAQPLGWAQRP